MLCLWHPGPVDASERQKLRLSIMINRFSVLIFLLVSPVLASQPSAPSPVEAPLRDLTWGQLNFLHTTDTHGWHAGHLQEYI
jgi:2',3'-cyclic-nucleotide 2'-phosphodiesterase (5'-nucleotidase family)